MKPVSNFGEFLLREMELRGMSARELARFTGVAHGTINKFLEHGVKDVGYPSVDVLIKIAKATNTDICFLIALVAPEVSNTGNASPDAMITSQRIEQLPESIRDIVDDIIIKHTRK
jgi:transcriptional regulator with XRE-family HTH domain